jgi:hypothetical protein
MLQSPSRAVRELGQDLNFCLGNGFFFFFLSQELRSRLFLSDDQ